MTVRLCAVVGRPILHSRSPAMHNAAFAATGIEGRYFRLASRSAQSALRTARSLGLAGMNVTAPFKEDVARHVDALDETAARLGAVNTVVFEEGGRTRGFNTDVDGVALALRTRGHTLAGKTALVIGAGGAGKAATLALLGEGAKVVIGDRVAEKAASVAAQLGCSTVSMSFDALRSLAPSIDVVVGCSGASEPVVPPGFLRPQMLVLEASYAHPTALVREAAAAGCTLADGRDWLLFQGAKAFELFSGASAPVAAMREALCADPPATRPNIALIGFMGAGKSCVAAELGRSLGVPVEEIDQRVERTAQTTIASLFASQGEAAFRRLEAAQLREAASAAGAVLSCGGGAILDPDNVKALEQTCVRVWLWADLSTVLRRVESDSSRPLLQVADRESKARALLAARIPAYAAAADMVVDTTDLSPREVAEVILDETDRSRPR